MRAYIAALPIVAISACSPSSVIENSLNPQERTVIRGAVNDIARGDAVSLTRKVPRQLAPRIGAATEPMHDILPKPPLEVSLVNANWTSAGGARRLDALYEVHGQSGWALVEARTQTFESKTQLTGIYVQPVPDEPRKLNAFNLKSAAAPQFGILMSMAVAIAVTIAALFRIWRSGRFRRRWLWTIGALFGVTILRLNWSTGQLQFFPLQVQLFSASAIKTPIFAPWVLSVSIPLVAIIALLRRRSPASAEVD
jgi:hypothetical protein